MSLIGALNVGKSALAAHQASIQVTSNNIANAGNADYTRQVARITPGTDYQIGANLRVGSGVNLSSIQRQIDESLENRLRGSMSDTGSAQVRQEWMGRVEGVFQALGDNGLSTQMGAFFNSWSGLANKPQDTGLRQVVLQNGASLAGAFHTARAEIESLQKDSDKVLAASVSDANSLAQQVADLNGQIARAEGGGGPANALRDQRDAVLKKLSDLLDIKVQPSGDSMVNVQVGSEMLVLGATNRGLAMRQDSSSGTFDYKLVIREDNASVQATSGKIGGQLTLRTEMHGVRQDVDDLAGSLIFELNKIHSSGQGLSGYSQITAANAVNDPTAALNSAAAGLPFDPTNGSFVVHVHHKGSDLTSSTLVQVDLNGLGGNDTTLQSLATSLGSIGGLTASVSGGKLQVQAGSSDLEISFSQDTSGVLASLGINSFFSGRNASDIAVNDGIKANPSLLAASRNGQPADNQTALAIAALETASLKSLNGASLTDKYNTIINGVAGQVANAKIGAEAAQNVQDTLTSQREALSGVSLDEEAINLIREQNAFQGAARIITVVDELMKTLVQMV